MAEENPSAPTTLRWAVRLMVVEAAALAVVTVWLIYELATTTATSVRGAVLVTVYAGLMASLFGLLGWALHHRRAWARGPAIVLEMLLIPIGYYMTTGGLAWLGLPVMAFGLFGAGMLLAPSTRTTLGLK
jgi:hypothetical protein